MSFNLIAILIIFSNFLSINATGSLLTTHTTVKQQSRLTPNTYKQLIVHSSLYLQNNFNRLVCQKNESGFIRINIPSIPQPFFRDIKKLRINYWSPDHKVKINPESIHNHPSYFESLLITGGYSHEIYENGTKLDQQYDLYRIFKDGDQKTFAFIGQSPLKALKSEVVEKHDIAVFPKDLIHKVIATQLNTLSLNAVFDNEEDISYYNIYLTSHGTLQDVKTTRGVLPYNKSKFFVKEIIELLEQYRKEQ